MFGIYPKKKKGKILTLLTMFLRVIFNSLFGLSVNYWMAISTRFLLGSLNGLLGAIKVLYSSTLLHIIFLGCELKILNLISLLISFLDDQAYSTELFREEHQAIGMSAVRFNWRMSSEKFRNLYRSSYWFCNVEWYDFRLARHGAGDWFLARLWEASLPRYFYSCYYLRL